MMDKTQQKKSSGVLMHLSSLPSEYGIGSMGAPARKFVDFLKKAGRHTGRCRQSVLPAMEIRPISLFRLMREIRILLIWKCWKVPVIWKRKIIRRLTGKVHRTM